MRRTIFAMVILLAISGCTAESAPPPSESPSPDTSTDIVAEALNVLGPVPTAPPLSPEEEERARIAAVESGWDSVRAQYPDAQRPSVEFEHYSEHEEYLRGQIDCLRDLGLKVDLAHDADGAVNGFSLDFGEDDGQNASIGSWSCQVRYPQHPRPPATPEQLGYLYDYFTQFVVPCLEAHGQPQAVPLTRAEFIARWPDQGWFPSSNRDAPDGEATDAACPSVMPDMR